MSSDESQSISTTSSSPWAAQQPYLQTGFQRAQSDVLNKPQEFYPNSAVVPFSGQTEQALQMQEQRALGGDPTVRAGQQQVQGTLQGDYLNSNPYLSQAITNATDPIMDQFKENVIPGIQSGFSSAGRYGSGLQAQSQQRAGEAAMDQAGKVAQNMSYKNYGDERQRQQQAATLAPTYGQQAYGDIANLAGAGQAREQLAGNYMQDDINRFNADQAAPKNALADYMALIGGGQYGMESSTSTPYYTNTASDVMGGLSSAAGIAGSLWGKGGIWP